MDKMVYKCLCCSNEIKQIEGSLGSLRNDAAPEDLMWNNGIVFKLEMGYGSLLDGQVYYAALCDFCIVEKKELIPFSHDYMSQKQVDHRCSGKVKRDSN
jgi:hypothetical protein